MADNNLGAILCPNCGKLISSNADACVHCGTKNPNLWGFGSFIRKILGGETSLVPIITTACISMFVLSLLLKPDAVMQPGGLFGLLRPASAVLDKLGMTGKVPIAMGRWWTLITAIYLHGGLLHIIFNVMWIRNLGPSVEEFFGISRSFIIYTVAGALGFFVSAMSGHYYTLGASGSIFGLLGALVFYGRKRGGTFGQAIYKQSGTWALIGLVFGFVVPVVDNAAHIGGFIGGYLAANALGFIEMKREQRSHQLLALALIGLTFLSFALNILG